MELVYSERPSGKARHGAARTAIWPSEARGGDMVAFEALVSRKTPAVVSLARRIVGNVEDARDVAQMVFLRVWERDPPLRRDVLAQHLALPDRDEPLDRLPAQRAQPRAGPRRDAPPGARARGVHGRATRRARPRTRELARLFETVSGTPLGEAEGGVRPARDGGLRHERDRRDPGLRRVHRAQPPLQRPPDPPQGDARGSIRNSSRGRTRA